MKSYLRLSKPFFIVFLTLSALLLSSLSWGKTLYRYVNDDGLVILDDNIPADSVGKGYSIVNEYGVVIKVIPPQKTKAQIREDEVQAKLKRARQRRMVRQINYDAALLSTYTSIDDIIRKRGRSLANVQREQDAILGRITLLKKQIVELEKQEFAFRSRKEDVPENIVNGIAKTERQIGEQYAILKKKDEEKQDVWVTSDYDSLRFKFLMAKRGSDLTYAPEQASIVKCDSFVQCNKGWIRGQAFIKKYSKTLIRRVTEKHVLTDPLPKDERVVSLLMTRAEHANGVAELMLRAQCYPSEKGELFCKGKKVHAILAKFKPYLGPVVH